jgi:(p)ppGpp synthase/HD superfamily hydrolase
MNQISRNPTFIAKLEQNSPDQLFKILLKELTLTTKEAQEISETYNFASKTHKNQTRDSGAPFITHPLITAILVSKYTNDLNLIKAALLHDTIEDSPNKKTSNLVLKKFGSETHKLIENLSKVESSSSKEEKNLETIKKTVTSNQAEATILIKLADRLHNTITLNSKSDPEKRIKKAEETINIYVPLARSFGFFEIAGIMEQVCISILKPELFAQAKEIKKNLETETQSIFETIKAKITKNLPEVKIRKQEYEYSNLIQKIESGNPIKTTDLFFIQIITTSKTLCYEVLNHIGHLFPINENKISDFISTPKDNNYQAIHFSGIVQNSYLVRFHICSEQMHIKNQIGNFKLNPKHQKTIEQFRQISNKSPADFVNLLKNDLLSEKITIHFKDGSIQIPKNSTTLDAAFIAFGEKALYLTSIDINQKKSHSKQQLKNNDLIEIRTKELKTASINWLRNLNTETAKNFLQNFLKEQSIKQKIQIGSQILQLELDRYGKGELSIFFKTNKASFPSHTLEEICILIAEGRLKANELIDKNNTKKSFFKRLIGSNTTQVFNVEEIRYRSGLEIALVYNPISLETFNPDILVMPGGWHFIQHEILKELGLYSPIRQHINKGESALFSCAGAILARDKKYRQNEGCAPGTAQSWT